MKTIVIALLAVIFVSVWILSRRGRTKASVQKQTSKDLKATSEFHAVAIIPKASSCDAAKSLSGQRFLATEAPHLPLADCDAATCECRFVHYGDRRSGHERRSPFGSGRFIAGTGEFARERRELPDRRKDADSQ